MVEQIKNDVMERAIHEACMCIKDLALQSIKVDARTLEGKIVVHINDVLMCERSCKDINIDNLAEWEGIAGSLDEKWQQTNSRVEKRRIMDDMVSEFRRLVLQSA